MSSGDPDLRTAFECGELEVRGQFMLGSNYTFLVAVHHAGVELPAVYKPSRGEQPLWDFPENSLAQREVAAYLVSEALGLHFVPFTTLRQDGPLGRGSLQQYIEYDPEYHYFSFSEQDKARLQPAVLFDLLCNNADRKGSHVLVESGTHKLWLIDHGICFHAEDKLRTVMWDFAGQPIPDELLSRLSAFIERLSPGSNLVADLEPYLRPREVTALRSRARELLRERTFRRLPADRRATPWPPL
jgi:uncharacterized repeat protein (TIGR03843 family)